jgi:hypothetical protein
MSDRRIITEYVHPPIPIRQWDWSAKRDGDDEGGRVGYGATEQDAIDDLHNQEAEDAE